MTYHKRPVQTRKCAHCKSKFESNHKSRLYCCQSCNTLAWRARNGVSTSPEAPRPTSGDLSFSAPTVGVVAAGTLAANAATYLAQQVWQGGTETELLRAEVQAAFADLRADLGLPAVPASASFVPAEVRTATGPLVQIGPKGGPLAPFMQVPYRGRLLYYCAAEDVLLYSTAASTYQRVSSAAMLATLVATPPQGQHVRQASAQLPVGAGGPAAALPDLNVTRSVPAARTDGVADAQEVARMAAFDRILREGLGLPT